jgi:hypothetical protein
VSNTPRSVKPRHIRPRMKGYTLMIFVYLSNRLFSG